MNTHPKDTLNITITGILTIERSELDKVLARFSQAGLVTTAPTSRFPEGDTTLGCMGFTLKQAAESLGLCNDTVYRLLKRGLLRSSSALRHKVIPKSEIERFLKETTRPL